MKKQKFQDFLKGTREHDTSFAEAGLYIAEYFELDKYIKIFTYLKSQENNGEEIDYDSEYDVENTEAYKMYNEMLSWIETQHPLLYRKMDKYFEQW